MSCKKGVEVESLNEKKGSFKDFIQKNKERIDFKTAIADISICHVAPVPTVFSSFDNADDTIADFLSLKCQVTEIVATHEHGFAEEQVMSGDVDLNNILMTCVHVKR